MHSLGDPHTGLAHLGGSSRIIVGPFEPFAILGDTGGCDRNTRWHVRRRTARSRIQHFGTAGVNQLKEQVIA